MIITKPLNVRSFRPGKENIQIISISETTGSEAISSNKVKRLSVSRILLNSSKHSKKGVKPIIPEKPKAIGLAWKKILEKKDIIENQKDFVYRDQDKDNQLPIKTIKRVSKIFEEEIVE